MSGAFHLFGIAIIAIIPWHHAWIGLWILGLHLDCVDGWCGDSVTLFFRSGPQCMEVSCGMGVLSPQVGVASSRLKSALYIIAKERKRVVIFRSFFTYTQLDSIHHAAPSIAWCSSTHIANASPTTPSSGTDQWDDTDNRISPNESEDREVNGNAQSCSATLQRWPFQSLPDVFKQW